MNIFILHSDPQRAAEMLCDSHVCKMPTETAQILHTVSAQVGLPQHYLPTHEKHPCVRWAGAAQRNFIWLWRHGQALCAEYYYRYGKQHAALRHISAVLLSRVSVRLAPGSTPHVQCMPEQYRGSDAVEAYRRYYIAEKQWQKRKDGSRVRLARWEHGRAAPEWWREAAAILAALSPST